ncbi:hypothetical protein AaE_008567 [Aphanomyces astaci]|uniref:Aldehyde dehydrogenase domain-containing protein n=1 Tax=Aphanomyces astaci TaxID=112090 RepID=A0A6A5AD10_APHAT|nr:hypothetical protein AaE_008567 [Aphanomyces astaci]
MEQDTTLGPMALASAPSVLSAQVADAVAKGGKVLTKAAKPSETHDPTGRGRFFPPTLVRDCNHNMDLMKHESFGPILGVMAVDSDEEAVHWMNDSSYGLTAGIFTKDIVRYMGDCIYILCFDMLFSAIYSNFHDEMGWK